MILPSPGDGFGWMETRWGPALVCHPLAQWARHAFTSRPWGLGLSGAPDGSEAWRHIAETMEVDSSRLRRVRQVHGAAVVEHRAAGGVDGIPDGDIIICDDPTAAIAVQAADCIPLLLADVRTGCVAAAHAGWRGLSLRVPLVAVEAMVGRFGSRAADILAAIGPSIGPCCYEVGEDVAARFEAEGFSERERRHWFQARPSGLDTNPPMRPTANRDRSGRRFMDLWAVARDQLMQAGIAPDRIRAARLCTASHPDAFCSYRRDGAAAGRLAAVIRPSSGSRRPEDARL